jgi:hypothetical protein
MKAIYQAENIIDAYLMRDAMEDAGIPAYVSGAYLTGAIGELAASGLVSVMVANDAEDAALKVKVEVEQRLAEARAAIADDDFDPGLYPA